MIFTDQHVMVLDGLGHETGEAGLWSDELEAAARAVGGLVVVINSEPAVILLDCRPADGYMCEVDGPEGGRCWRARGHSGRGERVHTDHTLTWDEWGRHCNLEGYPDPTGDDPEPWGKWGPR